MSATAARAYLRAGTAITVAALLAIGGVYVLALEFTPTELRKLLAGPALFDEQHELLERKLGTRRVNARDRARVARVHVAQIIERFLPAELREQTPIGLHAQAAFEQLLRSDAGEALIVLRIEQAHMIRMAIEHELLGVLDGD